MSEIETLKKQKDGAYFERNQLVSALSKLFPAHLAKHPEEDKEWDYDWRTIVVIKLPVSMCKDEAERHYEVRHTDHERGQRLIAGSNEIGLGRKLDPAEEPIEKGYYQLSWHIHDSEIPLFDHLTYQAFEWDGHLNEDKYRRLRLLDKQKQAWGKI